MNRKRLLLVDTNVWIDYFMKYEPTCHDCAGIVEAAADDRIGLLVAPTTLKDIFYIIPRQLRRENTDGAAADTSFKPAAWACIEFILSVATPAPQSAAECELARALRNTFDDLENSLILAAAETADADYIVTSDQQLLSSYPEVFVTPKRALELIELTSA